MAIFRGFDRALILLTSVLVAGLTALMTGVVLLGVFARYVLNDALPWPEEVARYSMIWISWLGGGIALRRGAHIATDLVVNRLPTGARTVLLWVGNLAALAFLALCLIYGWQLVGRVAYQSTIALGISMQLPYASVPVGAALMIYHLIVAMVAPTMNVPRTSALQA